MKRRTWLILLGVVAFVSAGLAIALNVVLASKIAPPEGAELVELSAPDGGGDAAAAAGADEAEANGDRGGGKKPRGNRTASLDSYMKPIMDRSLFDSSKVGSSGTGIAGADGEEQEATDLGATLILTSAAPLLNDRGEHLYEGERPLYDARFSTALILEEGDDAVAQVYLVGDELGDSRIDEIARRRVYVIRGNGAREYLEIGGAKPKKKKSSGKSEGKKKRGRIDWSEGVTKLSDTHYQVDRSSIENALANLDRLSRDARVVPNFVDGKSNGFKVFGIKRNSAYKTLGLKNNDVITGVNGMELTSPDKALEVYSKLQNESSISLEIVRKGDPVTMEYDIL